MTPQQFKELREINNFSKVTLAKILHVSVMTVYRYEMGKRKIPFAIAQCMKSLPIHYSTYLDEINCWQP